MCQYVCRSGGVVCFAEPRGGCARAPSVCAVLARPRSGATRVHSTVPRTSSVIRCTVNAGNRIHYPVRLRGGRRVNVDVCRVTCDGGRSRVIGVAGPAPGVEIFEHRPHDRPTPQQVVPHAPFCFYVLDDRTDRAGRAGEASGRRWPAGAETSTGPWLNRHFQGTVNRQEAPSSKGRQNRKCCQGLRCVQTELMAGLHDPPDAPVAVRARARPPAAECFPRSPPAWRLFVVSRLNFTCTCTR